VSNFWEKLSPRERYLFLATMGLVLAGITILLVSRAVGRVRELNHTIDRLEENLLRCKELDARGVSVEKAFGEVAAQHSSAWTEAEIHDKLRQEIYRLALEDPNGSSDSGSKLVDIPTLRQGKLNDSGLGYREYQMDIKIPSSDIYSIIIFLMRLQQSPQSLRIDGLDIGRSPESQLCSATISVTRTVVGGAADAGEAPVPIPKQAPALAAWDGSRVEDWQNDGCDLSLVSEIDNQAVEGGSCLRAVARQADANTFMRQEVEARSSYELALDVTAKGNVDLLVADDATGQPYEGTQELTNDGKTYRLQIHFTVPGEAGDKVKIRAPLLHLKDAGAQVYVDNVVLRKAAE
jgi:hypothetical protein